MRRRAAQVGGPLRCVRRLEHALGRGGRAAGRSGGQDGAATVGPTARAIVRRRWRGGGAVAHGPRRIRLRARRRDRAGHEVEFGEARDRKSTRLNSSHGYISYAVFCLKKKKD